jgi:2-keto-4-pentenoate hydratase
MSTAKRDQWLDATLDNVLAAKPIENISLTQPDITTEAAYDLQHQLIARLQSHGGWGDIYGYKAALTAPAAQQAMGINEPIIGALFQHGAQEANVQTAIQADRPVLLETELGFTLSQAITEPVSADNVLNSVSECRGMIELAAPNLQQRPSSIDLISSNSASYGCLAADTGFNPAEMNLDSLEVSLTRLGASDEILHSVPAGTVMQGQLNALAWLVNTVLAKGYALAPGHVLMTGSIGNMHPGAPGDYRGDFGVLGKLAFRLSISDAG